MMREGEPFETFASGTLAGAGCFRCQACGFAVALHEGDEVPNCPHCGGEDFKRSSIFGDLSLQEPVAAPSAAPPSWLDETRRALDRAGEYLAFDEDGQLRVVLLRDGWTRIGRSLSADIRFDDPTVSRRHALVNVQQGAVRILDDRSLNGVFVNGERIDLRELCDNDEITVGRFRLYLLRLSSEDHATGGPQPARDVHQHHGSPVA